MLVSVIIPTYKPGDYIIECLNSMCDQTLDAEDFEVIVILNGCNEPWHKRIQDYISDKRIRINLLQTNQAGVSNARNIGIEKAKGDYIMFLDDDDYVSPSTLADLVSSIAPDSIAVFKPLAFYEGKECFEYSRSLEYNKKSKDKTASINSVRKVFSGPVMKLIPKSIIGDRRYNTRYKNGEDSLFMFLISDRISKVTFAPETAIYYRRIRQNSATTSKASYLKAASNSLALIKEYTKIYFKHPFQYNFVFYATRVMGAIKAIIYAKGSTF